MNEATNVEARRELDRAWMLIGGGMIPERGPVWAWGAPFQHGVCFSDVGLVAPGWRN